MFFRQKPFFPNFCEKPFFPNAVALKIAQKCPSQSLYLQNIPVEGPPDPHLRHGEHSCTLHTRRVAACHAILSHKIFFLEKA